MQFVGSPPPPPQYPPPPPPLILFDKQNHNVITDGNLDSENRCQLLMLCSFCSTRYVFIVALLITELLVKYNNVLSDYYYCVCKNGLLQGEVLSPILFCMYVNDCEMLLLSDNCPFVET